MKCLARGPSYMQKIVEYQRQNCYIPTFGMCFFTSNNFFTKKGYTEELQDCNRTQQRRTNAMTSATIQQFCRKDENITSTLVALLEQE